MVVLASDTITPPLLPRNIHISHSNFHPVLSRKLNSVITTTNNKHNMANNWSTRTKIIFAVCCVAAIFLVFALALFLQCRRRRRAGMTSPRDRSSALAIAENQGYGGFRPGLVNRLNDQMGRRREKEDEARFSEQPGGGMYYDGTHRDLPSEKFENVPLEGRGHHLAVGGAAPTRPGDIYQYGDRQSRFSP